MLKLIPLVLVVGCNNLQKIQAYSAGYNIPCLPDGQAAQIRHGGGNGPLSVGGTIFEVDGKVYTADDVVRLPDNTTVTFNIVNYRTKGFCIRLSAKDDIQDVTNAFNPVDETNMMRQGTCVAPVAGVVHTNRDTKPLVQVTFNTTGFSGEFSLQITNVLDVREWYYSPFKLVVGTVGLDTPAPTKAPRTSAPSSAPKAAPSSAPTKAPVRAPTKAPVSAPTKAPTAAPVSAPSKAPILLRFWKFIRSIFNRF